MKDIVAKRMARERTDAVFTPSIPYTYCDTVPAGRWEIGMLDDILPGSPRVDTMDLPVRIDEDGVAICFVVSGGPGGQRLALVNLDALAPGREANLVLEAPARFLATQTFAYAPEPYFKGRFAIEDANRVVLASIDRNGHVIGSAVAAA